MVAYQSHLNRLVELALEEDIGIGDVTTQSCVDPKLKGWGELYAKQDLVLSGQQVFNRVFSLVDPQVKIDWNFHDGDAVNSGTVVAEIAGALASILTGERVALNFVMHLSGVATQTRAFRQKLQGHPKTVLLDTRKTTPGMRQLEKQAVLDGGGMSHRKGLFDGVLIKDNHIKAAGSVGAAIKKARKNVHHLLRIECEVSNNLEIDEALAAGCDALLLDNMNDANLLQAVTRCRAKNQDIYLEASGNMTADRLATVAETGVNAISMGALTHSATSVDMSLKLIKK